MTFTSDDILAVVKLVIYIPLIFGAAYICFRHGIRKNAGWIYLAIFCLVRIVGSGAELYTISSTSKTAYTIAAVCSVLGLSPLLLATLGIVSRPFKSVMNASSRGPKASAIPIRILQLLCLVGLIMAIIGATNAPTPAQVTQQSDLRTGVILFTVVYFLLVLVTVFSSLHMRSLPEGESAIIGTVAFALILLAVRLLYSLLGTFGHKASFNAITGSLAIQVAMATCEEVVVTLVYIILGVYLTRYPDNGQTEKQQLQQQQPQPQQFPVYRNAQPVYGNSRGRGQQEV